MNAGLPEVMLHATRSFASPSPIQGQCLPIVMSGRDLVGIAATGSGKTIAFGLPCLRHIQAQKDAGGSIGSNFLICFSPKTQIKATMQRGMYNLQIDIDSVGPLCSLLLVVDLLVLSSNLTAVQPLGRIISQLAV